MRRALVLALVATVPVALFALATALYELPRFLDPCHEWGAGQGGTYTIEPGDQCQQRSSSSQTAAEAATWLLLVQGGLLVGAVFGAWGAWRERAWAVVVSGLAFLAETPLLILGGTGILTFVAGVVLVVVAVDVRRAQRNERG